MSTSEFLTHLHRGGTHSYWWTAEGKRSTWWPTVAAPRPPVPPGKLNVYFGVHPTNGVPRHKYVTGARAGQEKPASETRAHIEDIAAINCLFSEFDAKDFESKAACLSHIADLFPSPSVLVDSGGGYHAYWLFAEPHALSTDEIRAEARDIQSRWVAWAGGDRGAKDLARVLRVPGTRNYKDKYAPDYPLVTFVWQEMNATYSLSELAAVLPEPEQLVRVEVASPAPALTAEQEQTRAARYVSAALHSEVMRVSVAREGTRNDTLFRAAAALGSLVNTGHLDENAIHAALQAAAARTGLSDGEASTAIESGIETGRRSPRSVPASARAFSPAAEARNAFDFVVSAPAPSRLAAPIKSTNGTAHALPPVTLSAAAESMPGIQVNERQLREVSNDVLDVFARLGPNRTRLFVRGGLVSRVVRDEKNRATIEPVSEHALVGAMTRAANFFATRTSGGVPYQRVEDPPSKVARDILTMDGCPLPGLNGITEAPVMRPDGTILDRPGYDESTKLFYAPTPELDYPGVPDQPTRYQVERALEALSDLVSDFPFLDPASRANYIGLLMTPVLRHSIIGHVPMALISAADQGTGKTILSELPSILSTGANPSLIAMPYSGEEWVKSITTSLLSGTSVVVLDNVGREIVADELAQVLTSDVWEARLLGLNRSARIPHRAVWIANGNNIKVRGDFASRCYFVRIIAPTARPWERDGFRIEDIKNHVRLHRGEIIAAVLTMARAWHLASQPARATVRRMRTFTEWARVVGGILEFAGEPNFLGNTDEFYNSVDEEAPQWEGFLSWLRDKFGEAPFTVARVCSQLSGGVFGGEAADIVPSSLGEPLDDHGNIRNGFKHRLGKALARRVGTRFGAESVHIERAGGITGGVVQWVIRAG